MFFCLLDIYWRPNWMCFTPCREFLFLWSLSVTTSNITTMLVHVCSCSLRGNNLKVQQHTRKLQFHAPTPILEAHKSTTLYICTTDAISQKFQTTGAWALPPRRTWWIGHTLGMLVNGRNIWHTAVLQPRFITASRPCSLECRSLCFSPPALHAARLFLKAWIWVKCTEAPARRAAALSKRWFLIHLFVVVYACLL